MPDLDVIQKRLTSHMQIVGASEFFQNSVELLRNIPFTRIRCLALGSPTQEFQALYQLAYLKLIAKEFSIDPRHVSVCDPVFTAQDVSLFNIEQYVVEIPQVDAQPVTTTDAQAKTGNSTPVRDSENSKEPSKLDKLEPDSKPDSETLFYMPHAPRCVINDILETEKPAWILGNDVRVTMGSLSKVKFFDQYRTLAKLVHIAEKEQKNETPVLNGLEFTVVTRRRRNRPKKNQYVEPDIDYALVETYFDHVTITRIVSPASAPWNESFSDLALNVMGKHGQSRELGTLGINIDNE